MDKLDANDLEFVLQQIRFQASIENIRITQHAQEEMVEEDISLNDVLAAIDSAQMVEIYPEHRRGSCCLLSGLTQKDRPIHIVCTTEQPILIIITVYEPKLPKWITPTQRSE